MFGNDSQTINDFEATVRRDLALPDGAILLVGLSGGADSVALTAALARIAVTAGYVIHCLHIDHGIRSEIEREADLVLVRQLCRRFQLPLRVVKYRPGRIEALAKSWGGGLEDAARRLRLRQWRQEARRLKADAVVLGHNADDQLENLLMRVLRGSGPAGLALWPNSRPLPGLATWSSQKPERCPRLVRPLLKLSRSNIEAYLACLGLSFMTDSTNTQPIYLRNRIRLKLMPLLDELSPGWRTALKAFGQIQTALAEYLARAASTGLNWVATGEGLSVEAAAFNRLDPILRVEALFQAINQLGQSPSRRAPAFSADRPSPGRPPSRTVLEAFAQGSWDIADLGLWRLRRTSEGRIWVTWSSRGQSVSAAWHSFTEPGNYQALGWRFTITSLPAEPGAAVSWPLRLPCILRTPLSSELAAFKTLSRAVVVEDRDGLVAAFGCEASGALVIPAKLITATLFKTPSLTDYARSEFFFILYDDGRPKLLPLVTKVRNS